jgi:hypothetical protein
VMRRCPEHEGRHREADRDNGGEQTDAGSHLRNPRPLPLAGKGRYENRTKKVVQKQCAICLGQAPNENAPPHSVRRRVARYVPAYRGTGVRGESCGAS